MLVVGIKIQHFKKKRKYNISRIGYCRNFRRPNSIDWEKRS